MFNRWPSLLLTITILIGVGVFFKRFDFMFMNQVRALISVLFGFATSCLLVLISALATSLSFVWLIQKRPLQAPWPIQAAGNNIDTPNMHPRAGSISSGADNHRRATVCTISSMLDQPPKYEDALIYSKPVSWTYLNSEKVHASSSSSSANDISSTNSPTFIPPIVSSSSYQAPNLPSGRALCAKHSGYSFLTTEASGQTEQSSECPLCIEELISNVVTTKSNSTGNCMAQLALSIVRSFTTIEPGSFQPNPQVASRPNRLSQDYSNRSGGARDNTRQRKASYCQLDINQLVLPESPPPKYCELWLDGPANGELSNNSNEPRAGDGS